RYAPFNAAPAERVAFFKEVLPADEEAVVQAIPGHSGLRRGVAEALRALHEPLLHTPPGPTVHVLGLGDCLLNELRAFLPARCRVRSRRSTQPSPSSCATPPTRSSSTKPRSPACAATGRASDRSFRGVSHDGHSSTPLASVSI